VSLAVKGQAAKEGWGRFNFIFGGTCAKMPSNTNKN
jgi:hypothetical protein